MVITITYREKGGEDTSRVCPNCHSKKIWKDGLRETGYGSVQRFLCRKCGFRFSKNSYKEYLTIGDSQLCAKLEAKKLDTATEIKTVAGTSPKHNETGKIVEFTWYMKKQGYAEGTIISRTKLLTIMQKRGANLLDPETVKDVISKQVWSQGRKENAVDAYTLFLNVNGGTWNPPIYRRVRKLPFIPTEQEIDALIASCGQKAAVLLQTLKETAARVGEAWKLRWTDLDTENRTVRITPEKGSDPRIFKISLKLLSMLLALPKKEFTYSETTQLKDTEPALPDKEQAQQINLETHAFCK